MEEQQLVVFRNTWTKDHVKGRPDKQARFSASGLEEDRKN
jgi:hypothetical protein